MTTILSAPKTKVFQLLWTTDDSQNEVENFIDSHPETSALRRNPRYTESRPHLTIPQELRPQNLLTGALAGPQKITVAPYVFQDPGKSLIMIIHLGKETCSHDGIVHGGLLATLLDECLTRCCCPAFSKKVAVTANLNIDYRNPAMANSYFILTAKITKLEGRKAWMDGRIETLPSNGGESSVIAEAKSLFLEPKESAGLTGPYKAEATGDKRYSQV
ncbi:hypothetical protein N7456_013163 [Penicillium angulare]|uniref:Thioesterase domain-containing protein n=1 Tax=Penicillium angulare TaxID=116970 RepID=A0A9W9EKX8_9EURO|nr:hypothetical protein N7456_013163 [Penicillium angulare]